MTKLWIVFCFILISTFYSCKKTGLIINNRSMSTPLEQHLLQIDTIEEPKKISASDLIIELAKGEEIQYEGYSLLGIKVQVKQNLHDYTTYKICPQDEPDNCMDGKFINDDVIPATYPGILQVTLKACVESIKILDAPCGPKTKIFVNMRQKNTKEASEILVSRYQLLQKIKYTAYTVEDLITEYKNKKSNEFNLTENETFNQSLDQSLDKTLDNFIYSGVFKNGDFYTEPMFQELILKAEEKKLGIDASNGFALTETDESGNWAYQDGKAPKGKEKSKSDTKDSKVMQVGAALTIVGFAAIIYGTSAMMPEQENLLMRYAKNQEDMFGRAAKEGNQKKYITLITEMREKLEKMTKIEGKLNESNDDIKKLKAMIQEKDAKIKDGSWLKEAPDEKNFDEFNDGKKQIDADFDYLFDKNKSGINTFDEAANFSGERAARNKKWGKPALVLGAVAGIIGSYMILKQDEVNKKSSRETRPSNETKELALTGESLSPQMTLFNGLDQVASDLAKMTQLLNSMNEKLRNLPRQ